MRVDCPHCSETVEVTPRHGLSGSLCPACNGVVPTPRQAPASVPPTPSRPPREELPLICPGCGAPRDRDGRRCVRCGEGWLFRVVATSTDGDDRLERLVEYVVHRQTRAEARGRLEARFKKLPAEVLGQLTETQARRVRQELEAFGVKASIERDATPVDPEPAVVRVRPWIAWGGGISAGALLAAGVYLSVWRLPPEPAETRPAPASTAHPAPAPAVPVGPDAPNDVLAGIARLEGDGLAFFVDPDGWAVAPLAATDEAGGADLRTHDGTLRATLGRADRDRGFGLFKAQAHAPYALSFGDATLLAPGSRLYLVVPGEGEPRLVADTLVSPNQRVGRRVFLRLGAEPGAAANGAPVFNQDGLVVGVYDRAVSQRAGVPLAVASNELTEGQDALLVEIHPARPRSERLKGWTEAAAQAERAEHPDVYAALEHGLFADVACPEAGCTGHVGLLALQAQPPAEPLEAQFYGADQAAGAPPAFGRKIVPLDAKAWREEKLAGSALAAKLPANVRDALQSGAVDGVHLLVADLSVPRPDPGAFRLVLDGLGGRRTEPLPVPAAAAAPASAPGRFGPFTGAEWRDRFQRLQDEIEQSRTRLADLRRSEAAGQAPPGTAEVLEREARQLAILQDRLTTLTREADSYHLPLQYRP